MNSRQQKKRIAARRRILGLEHLERREVLAGNVTAALQGGNLFINGDNLGNDITVSRNGFNNIIVRGNGTTVNGQASVTLNNFNRSIIADLNGGDDVISFERSVDNLFTIWGGLTVRTAGGNDRVNFTDTAVQGLLFIDTGSGNDQVNATAGVRGRGLQANGVASILTGAGNDVVSFDRSQFVKTTSILLETGNDNLFVSNSTSFKTTILNGGLGFDRLDTQAASLPPRPVIVLFETRGNNPAPTVNTPPLAVNDTGTVAEGANVSINVAGNDADAGGSLNLTSVIITQSPANGSAAVNSDGTVSYTHNGSETTSDSFRYTIKDNLGLVSGTATVNITVTPVNDSPTAVNDAATLAEGATLAIPLSTNDTDVDGTIDATSIVVTQNPANGTVVVNSNGTVSYTHNGSETTSDSFRYTIKDNSGTASGTATVAITVTPVNDAPVAVNNVLTVNEGAGGTVNVSTNDTDIDGTIDVATVVIGQAPTNGNVVVNGDGTVTYTHNGTETATDSFTYTIKDNNGLVSGTATVGITVTPVNDAPVAVDNVLTVNEGAGGTVNVSTNDTDIDGTIDVATVVIVQSPANGNVVVNLDGTVTYTHDGSETTTDSFTYTIKDNNGLVSGTATVAITVTAVNDAPVASDDSAIVLLSTSNNVTINVATNDTDADNTLDLTSIVITQAPVNGSVVVNGDGTVTYTHDGSLTTSDSFQYTIKDALGVVSNTATVSITIT
ncbi:MAG: tandem-95 repeat protein [Pirellulaceae bacterium]